MGEETNFTKILKYFNCCCKKNYANDWKDFVFIKIFAFTSFFMFILLLRNFKDWVDIKVWANEILMKVSRAVQCVFKMRNRFIRLLNLAQNVLKAARKDFRITSTDVVLVYFLLKAYSTPHAAH